MFALIFEVQPKKERWDEYLELAKKLKPKLEAIEVLCREARFLAVNTQSNAGNLGYHTISKYPRADYVCIAENEMRLDARDRRGDLRGMVRQLSQRLHCGRMVVTRGKRGVPEPGPE